MDAVKDFFMRRATVPAGRKTLVSHPREGLAWYVNVTNLTFDSSLNGPSLSATRTVLFFS